MTASRPNSLESALVRALRSLEETRWTLTSASDGPNFKAVTDALEVLRAAHGLSAPEPFPRRNDAPAVWDLVVADMKLRDATGAEKYGTRLQPHNGRDVLTDAYQEALDLAVYLRQAIYERDGS